MNSLTSILSLSQIALRQLDEPAAEPELRGALDAITPRARSLSSFAGTYRKVIQWPVPSMAFMSLQDLFRRLQQAIESDWCERGGRPALNWLPRACLQMNNNGNRPCWHFIRNVEQVTVEQATPRLWVQARQGRGGRQQIRLSDNGPCLHAGLERQTFLPFLCAREGGQGVGLTVQRQLMYGVGGRVRLVRPIEDDAAMVLSA
ncbi:hypothetical protein [Chitinimonas naiadis]